MVRNTTGLLFLMLIYASSTAAIDTLSVKTELKLSQNWKYHAGDNPEWASPNFDDSDWEIVRTDLRRKQLPKDGWPGIGWFRLHVVVDSTLWHKPLALTMFQYGASELYLNGELLYTTGKVGTSKSEERAYWERNPRTFVFPDQVEHLIAVRFSNFSAQEFLQLMPQAGFGVSLSELNARIEQRVNKLATQKNFYIFFTMLPFVLGVLHFLLFAFYSRAKENLYYAIFTVSFAIAAFSEGQAGFFASDPHDRLFYYRVLFLAVICTFPSVLRFGYSIFYTHLPKQFWVFLFGAIGLILLYWFSFPSPLYFGLFLLFSVLELFRITAVAVYQKKEGAWIIGGGYLFMILVGLFFILAMSGVLDSVIPEEPPFEGSVHYLMFLGPIVSMSIFLSRKFAKTSRDLEAQLIQVQELSEKAIEQERRAREEEIQRKLLEEELQTAHDMQMSLMPTVSPKVGGFDIAGRCIPASQVGGDFFQYFDHSGKLALALADVTGHAMAAAIPVVLFNGVLESQMQRGDPVKVLFSELNNTLHRVLDHRTFVCFTMGEIDLETRKLRLSNGGCPPPYHYRASTGKIVELQLDAYPLGVRADTDYDMVEVQLQSGDCVVFCSDGIAEAENESSEQFGYQSTEDTIRQACVEGLSAEAAIDRILEVVATFSGDAPQGDDMTCVVLRVG